MSTLAQRVFDAITAKIRAEDEFCDAALAILGVAVDRFEAWPFDDFHFDHYDTSFEFNECRHDFTLSPEQRSQFWDMGFSRCWLNYPDGSERHYWQGNLSPELQGKLKKLGSR